MKNKLFSHKLLWRKSKILGYLKLSLFLLFGFTLNLSAEDIKNESSLLPAKSYELSEGSQQLTVKGVVTDNQGNPVPGVTVLIKGTTQGTITDMNGSYSLPAVTGQATLVFSFVGMVSQELPVNNQSTINVSMVEDAIGLDEVVVVGYGTQTKRAVTGSITSVSEKSFNTGVTRSAADLLTGKVAGLTITQATGDVTAQQSLRLRGTSSLTGSSEPFVVIDGVPGLTMNSVAPQDIESISVLKDASSAAIYGARSGSGVILITTKKGAGKSSVDYSGYVAFDKVSNKPDVLTADEWRQYMVDNNINATPYDKWGASTDWFEEVTRTGLTQNHDLSFAGSGASNNYRASVSYLNQEGIARENYQEWLNTRLTFNQKAFKDHLDFSVIGTINQRETQPGNQFAAVGTMLPVYPVKLDDGKWFYTSDITNPAASQYINSNVTLNNQYFINGKVNLTINRNFSVSGNVLTERESSDRAAYTANTTAYGGTGLGSATRSFSTRNRKLFETTATYTGKIDNHNLTLMAGFSAEDNYIQSASVSNSQYLTNLFGAHNLVAAELLQTGNATSSAQMNRLMSYFGRANYAFKERYILTATVRRDGSSKFGSANKWGTFPSVSAAWRIIDEPFMQTVGSVVNELKLRAGYGVAGNQDGLNPYQSLKLYGAANTYFVNGAWHSAYAVSQNDNPNLKWEETAMLNVGVDFGLYDNRINGTIEFYDKRTSNLLYTYQVPVPPYMYPSMIANVGTMQNKGIEVILNGDIIRNNNLRWTLGINAAHNKNTILKLSSPDFTTTAIKTGSGGMRGGGAFVTSHIIEEGKPVGQFFGYKATGIDEAGNYIIDDMIDGVPGVTIADYTYIGDAQPKLTYGIDNSVTYKDFEFSCFLRGVYGNDVINFSTTANRSTLYLPGANVLASSLTWPLKQQPAYNSLCIENGSFARMENINIAYSIYPTKLLINKVRFYFTLRNAFLITKYQGDDPEVSMTGLAPGSEGRSYYPKSRTYLVGINVSF